MQPLYRTEGPFDPEEECPWMFEHEYCTWCGEMLENGVCRNPECTEYEEEE